MFRRLLPLLVLGSLLSAAPSPRPNVLWIIADDLSPDLACYGEQIGVVATPHLDALARESVRFTHAFGTASVCSPNRSAFNTGRYQTSIGAHHHRTLVKQALPDGVVTIPELFRRAGYFVSNGRPGQDPAAPMTQPGKLDWNFAVPGKPFDGTDWSQRAPGQPFFAQININEAHRPWTRDLQRPVDPARVQLPPYHPDHPVVRIDWSRYLEEVQVFDRQVGAILARLAREGLADNTVVMVFGDNGRSFAHDKGYLYDGGLRVPLLVRWPDRRHAGKVDERLISLIDLGPTCLAAAGLPRPAGLHGQSFAEDAWPGREVVFAAKDRTGTMPDRIRSVRSREFKYIRNFTAGVPYFPNNRYTLLVEPTLAVMLTHPARTGADDYVARLVTNPRPVEELYRLDDDPHELRNLAGDPGQADTVAAFRRQLDRWVEATGDRGERAEDPAAIAPYAEWLDRYLGRIRAEMGVTELTAPAMFSYWMNKYDLR